MRRNTYLTTVAVLLATVTAISNGIASPAPVFLALINSPMTADQLLQQGSQQYQAGQREAAIKSWQQAQLLYQQRQNMAGEGIALANLGAAYVALERYQDAIAALEAFLLIAQALNDHAGEAQALGNLGIAYKELGHYFKAIESHKKAGKLMLAVGNRQGLGRVLLNLGNDFEAVGDYESATIAYGQSLTIAQQTGDRVGESVTQGNLGGVYANLGKYDEAMAAYQSSLVLARSVQNREGEASALVNLGVMYHLRKHLDQAISSYHESLAIAKQLNNRKQTAEALGSLGLAYEDLKDYPKSIAYYEQSLAIVQTLDDPQLAGLTLNNLGHAFFSAGNLVEAEARLRDAIARLDALRPGLNDTYKASIFDTQIYTYNLLQQILLAAQKPEAALEITEHGRARAFVELLARRGAGEAGEARRAGEAGEAAGEANGRNPTPQPPTPNPQLAVQPITIAAIKTVARQQNATLVEYAIVPDDDFKAQGKQRAREAELLIWVVQPTGEIAVRRVDLKPLWQLGATLGDVVNLSRCLSVRVRCGGLAQKLRGTDSAETASPASAGLQTTTPSPIAHVSKRVRLQPGLRKLHQLLIEPIADLLPLNPNAHIIFIPQETLFLVPFAALQAADGSYLIEQHTILTAPAIQVLALTRQQQESNRSRIATPSSPLTPHSSLLAPLSSLIIGNPTMPFVPGEPGQPPTQLPSLPEAEKEAIAIAQLLGTKAITGNQATKVSLLKKLPTARLVHFATHGLLEYGSQSASLKGLGIPGAIALAPSNGDDGLLTTSDVLNLHLTAELVTLSACDTGQGRITGDGVIGLSRAFISAGVPSVIVSLWAVPDAATATLMTTFYHTLQQEPDKAQALRQAMLTTMKDYPAPIDWAAFTLIGEAE